MVNARNKKTPNSRKRDSSNVGPSGQTGESNLPGSSSWIKNSFTSGPLQNVDTNVSPLTADNPSASSGRRSGRARKLPERFRDSGFDTELSPSCTTEEPRSPVTPARSAKRNKLSRGSAKKNKKTENELFNDIDDSILAGLDIDGLSHDSGQPQTPLELEVIDDQFTTPKRSANKRTPRSLRRKRGGTSSAETTPRRAGSTIADSSLTSTPISSSPPICSTPPSEDHVYSVMDFDSSFSDLTQQPRVFQPEEEDQEYIYNADCDADGILARSLQDEFDIDMFSQGLPEDYTTPRRKQSITCALSEKLYSSYSPPESLSASPKSFSERLKRTLLENARIANVPPKKKKEDIRSLQLLAALQDAEAIQAAMSQRDVGPFYGLPMKVQVLLEGLRGIKDLYEWQHECLSLPAVKSGQNLVYSLPTSGGKTLVSEILILREILCKKRDAIFILPFVAIVQEKVRGINPFAVELNFFVEEYAAHKGRVPPTKKREKKSLYICTIEKANGLINSLIELDRLDEIGLVVVDELHMLGEGSRGAILEMTLAKIMHKAQSTQIIGMSATLSNISDLETFLNAYVYMSNFRPVELVEYVKMDDTIYEVNSETMVPSERIRHSRVLTYKRQAGDPDHLADLVTEVVPDHSCLVFCPTKKNCENVAELLCKNFPRALLTVKVEQKKDLYQALLRDGDGEVCPVLRRTLPFGVAYHHSGLTMDERRILEDGYLDGTLCVMCCTSTLAAGVNLPAKRVLIRSPYVGLAFLGRSQYKQMVGRAGRAGLDDSGESILITHQKDKKKVGELLDGPMSSCVSSLLQEEMKGMRQLLLTTIGLKVTQDIKSVLVFLQRTLCYVQRARLDIDVVKAAEKALQQLVDAGLVVQKASTPGESGQLEVTRLGRAVFKGCIDLDRGPQLYTDLSEAQQSLVLSNYLHLLYLVTPYDLVDSVRPDWSIYLEELGSVSEVELKVAKHVGVTEAIVAKKLANMPLRKTVDEFVVKRFYLTLMMYHLWKGCTIWDVAHRFQLSRGLVQNLLNSATAFASCIGNFCQELEEFWAYQDLFVNFVKKLSCGFMMELGPLLDIPGVKLGRARQLTRAGYRTLSQVAHADLDTLVSQIEHLNKKTARQIIASAQMMIQERLEALQEEALDIITIPADLPVAMETEVSTSE